MADKAAGRGSISVNAAGKVVEHRDEAQDEHTLMTMFLSGHNSMAFSLGDEDEEDTEPLSKRRMSIKSDDPRHPGFVSFPDPPCILPYETDDPNLVDISTNKEKNLRAYWKDHAGWLSSWPEVKANVDNMKSYIDASTNRPPTVLCKSFVVTCRSAVGIRTQPTQKESDQTGDSIIPGQVVLVDQIKKTTLEDGTVLKFLHLFDGRGWVFDSMGKLKIMAEATDVQIGLWWFKIVADTCVEVRRSPMVTDEVRSGWVVPTGEMFVVNMKINISGRKFFNMADGRGWVFEMSPLTGSPIAQMCEDVFLENVSKMDFRKLVPPTGSSVECGLWTYIVGKAPIMAIGATKGHKYGTFVNPGEVVKIDKIAYACGSEPVNEPMTVCNRCWLRLSDGRGWVSNRNKSGQVVMEVGEDTSVLPSWYFGNKTQERPKEKWMVGFV